MFMGSAGSVGRFLPRLEKEHILTSGGTMRTCSRSTRPIGNELSDELRQKAGIRILDQGWIFGQRHLTTKQTEVKKPADMAKLKIRVQPTVVPPILIQAMGGNPTPMDFKRGLHVDADRRHLWPGESAQCHGSATRAFSTTGVIRRRPTVNQVVLISEKTFQALTPAQQQILVAAAREAGDFQNQVLIDDEKGQLELVRMKVAQRTRGLSRGYRRRLQEIREGMVWASHERVRDAKEGTRLPATHRTGCASPGRSRAAHCGGRGARLVGERRGARYVFDAPFAWAEEFATLLFSWIIFLGAQDRLAPLGGHA